jgi:transcriptional regulator with XRE-family HTH domain
MVPEAIGQALSLLRAEKGISQKELASRMGLARDTSVSSIETGNPTARVVASYLRALGADYHALARAIDVVTARGEVHEGPSVYAPHADPLDEKVSQLKQALDEVVLAIKEKGR